MGYESKIYIVSKGNSNYKDETGKYFAEVIASYDLCKVYNFSDWFRRQPETDCYIYENSEKIIEDMYGESLKESTIEKVIEKIENCIALEDYYRRYFPILAMLKSFEENKKDWPNVAVLHYGH